MKRWKIVIGLLLLFISGVGIGIAGTLAVIHQRVQRVLDGGPLAARAVVIDRLSRKLSLNASQRERTATIIGAAHDRLLSIRKRNQPEIFQIIEDAARDLQPVLTPAQLSQLDEVKARFYRRWAAPGERPGP